MINALPAVQSNNAVRVTMLNHQAIQVPPSFVTMAPYIQGVDNVVNPVRCRPPLRSLRMRVATVNQRHIDLPERQQLPQRLETGMGGTACLTTTNQHSITVHNNSIESRP
nr:hypothetical protein [Alcanivorax xiamenensis]